MYKKYLVIVLALLLFFPVIARADCSDCSPGNCSACGCVESTKTKKCIYNNSPDAPKSCGGGLIENIPSKVPDITHTIYGIIQVLVPVLLVIFGSIDLVKAIAAGKEDEIKKNQSIVIKRLIAGVLVFFVFAIVRFFISITADGDDSSNIIKCAECFIEAKCK